MILQGANAGIILFSHANCCSKKIPREFYMNPIIFNTSVGKVSKCDKKTWGQRHFSRVSTQHLNKRATLKSGAYNTTVKYHSNCFVEFLGVLIFKHGRQWSKGRLILYPNASRDTDLTVLRNKELAKHFNDSCVTILHIIVMDAVVITVTRGLTLS